MTSRLARTVLTLGLAAGCAGAADAPKLASHRADKSSEPIIPPARWVLTDRASPSFEESGIIASIPREEPVIVSGVRVVVENGIIKRSAPSPETLTGFRAVPDRLGGGFVVFSENRVYRASEFLGELKAIADLGAAGGARPWLRSMLLRTPSGTFDLALDTLKVTRVSMPGLAEVLAADDKRAGRIDTFGRATVTTDGGATWTDVEKENGLLTTSLRFEKGELGVYASGATLLVKPGGKLEPPPYVPAKTANVGEQRMTPVFTAYPSTSRQLASDLVAQALASGALLPGAKDGTGARMAVGREQGLRVFSVASALPLADADYMNMEERFSHCQPVTVSARNGIEILLACTHEGGAHVLAIESTIGSPKLEATFPKQSGFVAGPHGRFGFAGRCGRNPPSGTDFGPATPPPSPPMYEEDEMAPQVPPPSPPEDGDGEKPKDEPSADAEAQYCARVGAAHWVERKLEGDDVHHLYRWVPGDDGTVTALILGKDEDDKKPDKTKSIDKGDKHEEEGPLREPEDGKTSTDTKGEADAGAKAEGEKKPEEKKAPHEGVRVIRIDPSDKALAGAMFPSVPPPSQGAPFRSIETDFWQDDDGSIRGWVHVPDAGADKDKGEGESDHPPEPAAKLRVWSQRGGRRAGVRIAADGKITILALPEEVKQVATGGRYALAMTDKKEGGHAFLESTDGGATWTEVEPPPFGTIDPPGDDYTAFGCSALGCAIGGGIARLGWGGPKPGEAKKPPDMGASQNPLVKARSPLPMTCKLEVDGDPFTAPEKPKPKPPKPPPPPPKAAPPKKPPPPPKGPNKPQPPPKTPPKPVRPKPSADTSSPPLPVSLRSGASSPLGSLKDQKLTMDVIVPFDPGAAFKKLSLTDKELPANVGSVAPILGGDKGGGVDLLMTLEKRRLRALSEAKLFPFDIQGRIGSAADGPGGLLVGFDENRGAIVISRGDATTAATTFVRVPDAQKSKLALGRAPDGSIAMIGYSTSSGEVFAGKLDLARAEVAPLTALAGLDTLTDGAAPACKASKPLYRFLAELPLAIKVQGKSGSQLVEANSANALLLISAAADRLCLDGVEMALPKGNASLAVRFDRSGTAAVRNAAGAPSKATCSLKP